MNLGVFGDDRRCDYLIHEIANNMNLRNMSSYYTKISPGYIYAIIASALYGSISTIAKPTVEVMNPLFLACVVSIIGAVIFAPSQIKSKTKLNQKEILLVTLVAICGAVLAPSLYFFGLESTRASDATVLSNSEIVFTVILATLFFKERLGRKGKLAMVLIFFGVFTLSTNFDVANLQINFQNFGNWLILATMFFWSIDNNISKIITKTVDVSKLVFFKSLIGGIILFVIILVVGIPIAIQLQDVPNVILLGLISFALPMYFFYQAIKRIGAVRTILIFSTSSLFGLFYTSMFLGEIIQGYHIVSSITMIFGILILFRDSKS